MNNYYYIKYKTKYLVAKNNLNAIDDGYPKSTLIKYKDMNCPHYPANNYKNQIKKGNDGKMYQSLPNKNNVYKWIIVPKNNVTPYGSSDDFILLFQKMDYNLNYNPKTIKKDPKYIQFLNNNDLKAPFDLPKKFIFNVKVNKIIVQEESYGKLNFIKFKVRDNKVDMVDFLHKIYIYFKKEVRDHVFLEKFTGNLDNDTIYINLKFGS